jgi:type II secretory ATPase GspE/PulE/Tfp pilus assembly ATPase PilB-like protein
MATLRSIEDLLKKPSGSGTGSDDSSAKAATVKAAGGLKPPTSKPSDKKAKTLTDNQGTQNALQEKIGEIALQDQEKLTASKAAQLGLPYISLEGFPIAPEALMLISRDTAQTLHVVPFFLVGDEVRLGVTQPSKDVDALAAEITKDRRANVKIYIVSEHSLEKALKLYEKLPTPKEIVYGYRINEDDLVKYEKEISNFADLQAKIKEVSTSDVITLMFGAALKVSASDIHVEAEEEDVKIRFRMDGRLREGATLPKTAWKQMITRLKLLAGVKINIEDVPQDGRITIYLTSEKVDIRVSFLPTAFGESVVMRLLRPKSIALEFDNLGIRGHAFEVLKAEIEKPLGMIITTGPTGSGKTTTLYAILKRLNQPEDKIITLEDPIEYKLQGINQSQIEHGKNYGFADGLRSILRQDPDIVMVGEIRDTETADIAVQAALTGHLVVSTIHTNSAAGAIPRFLSMGVKPFLLAPALNAVIGQRLLRRLCADCKVPTKLSAAQLKQTQQLLKAIPAASGETVPPEAEWKFMGPGDNKTCPTCGGMGYKGRVGIYEILTITNDIEEAILRPDSDASESEIQGLAMKHGMITMAQDGLLKALDGITSVEEVYAIANVDSELLEPGTGKAT